MIWLRADEKVPQRERYAIESKKPMFPRVWNPGSFHRSNILSKRCTFTASQDITNIPGPLADWHKVQARRSNRKLIIPADKA
jgi:hypothetical protein